jgi:protease-4
MSDAPPLPPAHHPHPAPRRGRGWKVFAILVTLLLVASVAANAIMMMAVAVMGAAVGAGGESPAANVQSETIHRGSGEKIAIIPVDGTVDEQMYKRIFAYCEFVKADDSIKAVILEVDSPGGTVTASDEIYHEFMKLKATNRKVVVSMRSLAASGGYYLSMAADKLYAQPTTLTGSIGVIWPSFEVTKLMEKWGVQSEVVKSDNAEDFKDAGSPFKKFTEQDRQYIKGIVNDAHGKFSAIVAKGRAGKLKAPMNEVANGKIWTSDDALKMGLIDEIAYMDDVCTKTASDAGLSNPTIIRLKNRGGLLQALSASSPIGGGKVEVKVDTAELERLTRGRLEYRWDMR